MNTQISTRILLSAVLMCVGCLAGCSQRDATDNDQGDAQANGRQSGEDDSFNVPISEVDVQRPINFRDAVARVETYREDIEVAIDSETPGSAHRLLGELGFVLLWLPDIAREAGLTEERCTTIETAVGELKACFDKVHQNLVDDVKPDFAAVANQVDAQIAQLATIVE